MKNRVSLLGGLILLGAIAAPADTAAQQFPGTSSVLTSPATRSLMMTLGYAPNDYCGFYFFLSTKNTGQFSDQLLRALLPMCAQWPQPVIPTQTGDGSDPGGTGSGTAGGSTGEEEGGGEGGEEGGQGGSGSTGGGSTGSESTGGGEGGSGDAGWPGSGGSTGGGEEGGGDPFGGGGAMATPEPVSLILLGTGLIGVGGFGARRRRKDPEA